MTDGPAPYFLEANFLQPHSLHPKIILNIQSNPTSPPPSSSSNPFPPPLCTLHALLLLNDKLFLDPYELEDIWRGSQAGISKDGWSLPMQWELTPPVPDLERPVRYGFRLGEGEVADRAEERVVENQLHIRYDSNGASSRIVKGDMGGARAGWMMEIPTHARYQQPHESGYREVMIGVVSPLANDRQDRAWKEGEGRVLENDIDVMGVLACGEPSPKAPSIQLSSLHPLLHPYLNTSSPSPPHIYPLHPPPPSTTQLSSPSFPSTTVIISLPAAIPSHQPYISIITLIVVLGCTGSVLKTLWDVWWRKGKGGEDEGERGVEGVGEGKKER